MTACLSYSNTIVFLWHTNTLKHIQSNLTKARLSLKTDNHGRLCSRSRYTPSRTAVSRIHCTRQMCLPQDWSSTTTWMWLHVWHLQLWVASTTTTTKAVQYTVHISMHSTWVNHLLQSSNNATEFWRASTKFTDKALIQQHSLYLIICKHHYT